MIPAAQIAPNFAARRSLVAEDLRRLEEPAVIFEYEGADSDGVAFYAYTVAGWLDGENVATYQGGCTVSGEVILIHAENRQDADAMAALGLHDTILALDGEEARYIEAHAALARLQSVGAKERIDQATKADADKSDAFMADQAAVRPLIGDDIVLTVGNVTD